jgi:glutamyl-tRNA synthetase
MSNQEVRVRIAPSNSGADVHAGNVRAALYNYLFAKQNKGVYLLRFEDSDSARCKDEYADSITETLRWIGLPPDEGYGTDNKPCGHYQQSKKLERYQEFVQELIERGAAYRCYCDSAMLDKEREEAIAKNPKAPWRYDGRCRDLKSQDKTKSHVVRFKTTTEGEVVLNDLVFGKMTFPNKENQDFVIMRSNGFPLYNLSVVVDDLDMRISHILRGCDHILNYTAQAAIYNAVGATIPVMAHFPMIRAADGTKLAKRNGASIIQYREAGYTPTAILNYLLRLGFGCGNQEIFSLDEMIERFSFSGCSKNDAKFDPKKFEATNTTHLKSVDLTSDDDYVSRVVPFLSARGIENFNIDSVKSLIPLIRGRAKTFIEAADMLDPFLRDTPVIDQTAKDKLITTEIKTKLAEYTAFLSGIDTWEAPVLNEQSVNWMAAHTTSIKEIGQPIRVAITGRTNSPELFQTMAALGKTTTINRLKNQQ